MEKKVIPGQLVESRSGRDSGRVYLVMEVVDDKYVLVADGVMRRVENPKKKNVKHLIVHPQVAEEIAAKLSSGGHVTNPELQQAVQRLAEAVVKEVGLLSNVRQGCH